MGWTLTRDLDAFAAAAEPLLRTRPVENTVALTIMAQLRADPRAYDDVLLGWWSDDTDAVTDAVGDLVPGPVRGAVVHTRPFPLQLAEVPAETVDPLVEALRRYGRGLHGVAGRRETAQEFAARWSARTGCAATVVQQQRLYELRGLVPLDPPPAGRPRVAGTEDRGLLIRWVECFAADIGLGEDGHAARLVGERLSYGGVTLWERAGRPVSMAARSRPGAGVVRVGPVYTPPRHRRYGYGSAVTAAATRGALVAGATGVVLFTDLANPTSNSIYRSIGYHPVEDRVVMSFGR